jgi:hypothetical protein
MDLTVAPWVMIQSVIGSFETLIELFMVLIVLYNHRFHYAVVVAVVVL